MNRRMVGIWTSVAVLGGAAFATLVVNIHRWAPRYVTIEGAVVREDEDPSRELPIADAEVTASDNVTSVITRSDASGHFKLRFKEGISLGRALDLRFRHPDYHPLDLKLEVGLNSTKRQLYIAAMKQIAPPITNDSNRPLSVVSNIRIRYTINAQTEENIGSAVRTLQVKNTPNVPCGRLPPCSPDGKWKASTGSVSLDAGSGNEFPQCQSVVYRGAMPIYTHRFECF